MSANVKIGNDIIQNATAVRLESADTAGTYVTFTEGTGAINWRDTLSVNWDFSNPINTLGQSSYNRTGAMQTIDGWGAESAIVSLVQNGITLERRNSSTAGFLMQRYQTTPTAAFINKTITASILVDGVLYSTTDTITSDEGTKLEIEGSFFNLRFYMYNYNQIATTIDILENTNGHVFQAIKLEAGSNQTLATQRNGVWVLNNNMDTNTELLKIGFGNVFFV